MPFGPGKYDNLCTTIRESTNADAVVVIVCGGFRGSEFSIQTHEPQFLLRLPDILEAMAKQIRADAGRDIAAAHQSRQIQ